jgi:outer membrane protein assembly factor BamB
MRLYPIALLIGALFIAGCSEDEDIYAPDPLVDIENQFSIETLWSNSIGDGIGEKAVKISPVYAYEKIYIADNSGMIAALDPSNGKTVWKKEFELPIAGGPAVASKVVAVGTSQGDVLVVDAETGEEKWRTQVSSEIISSPAIGDGYVVVRTVDGKIYALDDETGEQKWFYDESLPPLTLRGNSSPVISNGGVIAGFSNGKLAVFILEGGQLAWEKKIATPLGSSEIQRLVDVDLQPLIVGPTIYIGSFNGNLASISIRNGEFNWQRELSTFQDMAMGDLLLFATHENSYLSAINRSNGVIIWTQKDLHRRQLTAPAEIGDYVVVSDFEGYVHWLSKKTGKIVSRKHINSSGIAANPLVIDDKVILYSRDGSLVAIKKEK